MLSPAVRAWPPLWNYFHMTWNTLGDLAAFLSTFDSADLLASVAGLQLVPENAERVVRLIACAHAIASLEPAQGHPAMSLHRLRQIFEVEPLGKGEIADREDPAEQPFTEAFPFYGGSYIVFPGIAEESTSILHQMVRALFLCRDPFPDQMFIKRVEKLLFAMLALSNEVAQQAGLDRGIKSMSLPDGGVLVPDTQQMARLKQAVTFDRGTLAKLLARQGVELEALDPLVLPMGTASVQDYQVDRGDLLSRPIVRLDDQWIVAIPGMLLAAARHAVIRLAFEHGVAEELARWYSDAVWSDVIGSLTFLDNVPIPLAPLPPPAMPCFQHGFFNLDSDKLLYVMLVTDSLAGYDRQEVFGEWPVDGLEILLAERLRVAEEHLLHTLSSPPDALLSIVLMQGVGRLYQIKLHKPKELSITRFLSMSAADLQTIAWLEWGDRLSLWKFARASWDIRDRARVMRFGVLDEFSFYRAHAHSYFHFAVEVDPQPPLIYLKPGGGGELRHEVISTYDMHAAPAYVVGAATEVIAHYKTREIPIYAERGTLSRRLALLVEGLPLPLWIRSNVWQAEHSQRGRKRRAKSKYSAMYGISSDFTDMLAYWFWQCTPSLLPLLLPLASTFPRLLIQLRFSSVEAWQQVPEALADQHASPDSMFHMRVDARRGILQVMLHPALRALFACPDNSGERFLLHAVLRHLRELLPKQERVAWSDAVLDHILDRHVPLGLKKKLIFIPRLTDDLDPRGLPGIRLEQEADVEVCEYRLGSFLLVEKGLPPGVLPAEQRRAVLKDALAFALNELARLVASLSPEGLLEGLVAQNEALTRSLAFERLTLPTQLACFSTEKEMIGHLRKRIPETTLSSIASRFVIEFVVAQPPAGSRSLSLEVYDQLLALAVQIVNLGGEQDLIRTGLVDAELILHPAGRLITNYKRYPRALDAYLNSLSAGALARSTRIFERGFGDEEDQCRSQELMRQLDAAMSAEFGSTFTDLRQFMLEVNKLSDELNPVVPALPFEELAKRLATCPGWSQERVIFALDLLVLKPRADFSNPPAPFSSEDTNPWRYNRTLSYVRRPLLSRVRNGVTEVLWGPRHLYTAQTYLVELCLSGRLKAHTPQMQRLMSTFSRTQGKVFNDMVAELLAPVPGMILRTRVKKVGELRVVDTEGLDLGDIDVLAIDSERKRVWVIECKNLAAGRMPQEVANEIEDFFPKKPGKRSIIEKHQRRATWVQKHLNAVLTFVGVESRGRWTVEPLIVVDEELLAPYLQHSPVRILAFEEFSKWLQSW